jgi:hypothetical protein
MSTSNRAGMSECQTFEFLRPENSTVDNVLGDRVGQLWAWLDFEHARTDSHRPHRLIVPELEHSRALHVVQSIYAHVVPVAVPIKDVIPGNTGWIWLRRAEPQPHEGGKR